MCVDCVYNGQDREQRWCSNKGCVLEQVFLVAACMQLVLPPCGEWPLHHMSTWSQPMMHQQACQEVVMCHCFKITSIFVTSERVTCVPMHCDCLIIAAQKQSHQLMWPVYLANLSCVPYYLHSFERQKTTTATSAILQPLWRQPALAGTPS